MQNTPENLRQLSGHYGRTLDDSFFVDNNYNHLFFRFIRVFVSDLSARGRDTVRPKRKLLKRLVWSHVRNLFVSAVGLNGFMVRRELALSKAVAGWAGCRTVTACYAHALLQLFKRGVRVSWSTGGASGKRHGGSASHPSEPWHWRG